MRAAHVGVRAGVSGIVGGWVRRQHPPAGGVYTGPRLPADSLRRWFSSTATYCDFLVNPDVDQGGGGFDNPAFGMGGGGEEDEDVVVRGRRGPRGQKLGWDD